MIKETKGTSEILDQLELSDHNDLKGISETKEIRVINEINEISETKVINETFDHNDQQVVDPEMFYDLLVLQTDT